MSCFSICIPVVITGFVYYQLSMSKAARQAIDQNLANLTQVKDRTEEILHNVEQDSFQLAMDPQMNEASLKPGYSTDYLVQNKLIDVITRKRNMNRLIGDIMLYRFGDDFVLSSEFGNVLRKRNKMTDDIFKIPIESKRAQWTWLPYGKEKGYLTFWRQLTNPNDGSNWGILMYQVKIDVLQNDLKDMSGTAALYVRDTQGEILFSSPGASPALLADSRVKDFLGSEDSAKNSYIQDERGNTYLYTYVKTALGRTYVSVIPREWIAREFMWIQWLVALIVILVVGLSIGITMLHLRRIYNPIEQLIKYGEQLSFGNMRETVENEASFLKECMDHLKDETHKINSYVSRIEPTMREKFLQMLLEWNPLIRHSLNEDCLTHRIHSSGIYSVMVVDIENLHKEGRFLKDDEPIVAYSAANMMNELLQTGQFLISGYILNSHDGKATAILYPGKEMSTDNFLHQIRRYAIEVRHSMTEIMKIEVSVGIGKVYTHIADASISYQEAKKALQQRIYGKNEGVFFVGDGNKMHRNTSQIFPQSVETRMIQALRAGDVGKALEELRHFSESICTSEDPGFIYQCYFVLLASLLLALNSEGGNMYHVLSENVLFEELRECRTSMEIHDWFTDRLFGLFLKVLQEENKGKAKSAVEQICEYIRGHALEGVSLVQCSELVGMNPSYFSSLFKKETGINFVEFTIQCKLEQSKSMLVKTDMSIREIASAVGFSDRHFIRIFQKYNNTTPNQFRVMYRKT
ncbi:helix-turn-helix domain-containing protein [Paenibacillus cremeus]|uniref:helix-turn-helix domain-containing protein n=1 Tax=Paenibacillus cremeus TaxID=2163881 RepID=UPI0016466FB0|nr:helix-turn-helix domain-containing protein [Paenibacillus cremeus]